MYPGNPVLAKALRHLAATSLDLFASSERGTGTSQADAVSLNEPCATRFFFPTDGIKMVHSIMEHVDPSKVGK